MNQLQVSTNLDLGPAGDLSSPETSYPASRFLLSWTLTDCPLTSAKVFVSGYKSLVYTHYTTVRILQANAGVLTNFEVLDFLGLQGATVDRLHFLGGVTPTECKVFDYLIQSGESSYQIILRIFKFSFIVNIEKYIPTPDSNPISKSQNYFEKSRV